MLDPPFSLENYTFESHGNYTWPSDLSQCTDNEILKVLTWPGLCEHMGGEWSRPLVHFDNVAYAYLALFQVATFEGWMEVMEASIDAPLDVCLYTLAICNRHTSNCHEMSALFSLISDWWSVIP